MCFDGVKRLCHIRGKLRKKVWINQSDIVLIGLRDYQDAKADVILKYSADEARNLKSYGISRVCQDQRNCRLCCWRSRRRHRVRRPRQRCFR